jgi:hypothetical protein
VTSGGAGRTPDPPTTEESDVLHDVSPEVTAQRTAAAFDAVDEVLSTIRRRSADLMHLPAGRALVERAMRISAQYDNTPAAAEAEELAG